MKAKLNKINKSLILFVVMAALLIAGLCFLLPKNEQETNAYYNDYNLSKQDRNVTYEKVKKKIVISEDKTLHVEEFVTVKYDKGNINVGLTRGVARVNETTRKVNGKTYKTKTINDLELLSVDILKPNADDFVKEYAWHEVEGDFHMIYIGEDYDYKPAEHYTYRIVYSYDMGEDFIKDFDDFTFDIMDYDYLTPVLSFEADIILPKSFLEAGQDFREPISFRTNRMQPVSTIGDMEFSQFPGLTWGYDAERCTYFIRSTNEFDGFDAKTGLTMQLILPQGYFNTQFKPSAIYIFILISIIAAVVALAVCFIISKRSQKTLITPEFYPPKGYSPIDVARVYRGEVRSKDFASLILYWASVGLISIEPKANKKYFVLKKLKNYNEVDIEGGADPLSDEKEKEYFNALFNRSKIYDSEFASSRMDRKISKAVERISERSDDGKQKQKVLKIIVHLFSTLPFFLFVVWNILMDTSAIFLLFIFIFPFVGVMVFVYLRMPWQLIWFKLIWCGGFAGIPLAMMFSLLYTTYDVWNLLYIAMAIFLLGNYATRFIKVRPQADVKILGKVLGFRNFLKKVEVKKLELLVQDDPEYYIHILPFCYALGITRVMEKKFKSLRVSAPNYDNGVYNGVSLMTVSHSVGMINRHMSRVSNFGGGSGGFHGGGGGGHGGSSGGGAGGGGMRGR